MNYYNNQEELFVQDSLFGINDDKDERFRLNKLNLENFWYYDSEEFDLHSGSVFFRGRNGAGKSVITSTLIPLLIDGDVSARRIDPFGGKERKFYDTVLGEKKISGKTLATAYLAITYKQKSTGKIFQTGMGVLANSETADANRWYFVAEDLDLFNPLSEHCIFEDIVENGKKSRRYLTKAEFKKKFKDNKKVFIANTQKEYAEEVNNKIYHFKTTKDFKRYLDFLVTLKNPSIVDKNFIKKISDTLKSSINKMPQENFQLLNNSIETLNEHEEKKEKLKTQTKSLEKINSAFIKYRNAVMRDISKELLVRNEECEKLKEKKEKTTSYLKTNKEKLLHSERQVEKIKERLISLEQEKEQLQKSDVFEMQRDLENCKKENENLTVKIKALSEESQEITRKIKDKENEVISLKNKMVEIDTTISEKLFRFKNVSIESKLDIDYETMEKGLTENDFSVGSYNQKIQKRNEELKDIKKKEETIISKENDIKNEKNNLNNVTTEIELNQNDLEETQNEFKELIRNTLNQLREKSYADNVLEKALTDFYLDLEDAIDDYFDRVELQEVLDSCFGDILDTIKEKKFSVQKEIEQKKKEKKERKSELEAIQNQKEPVPILTKEQLFVLDTWRKQHIDFKLFYEMVDFKEGVSNEVKDVVERFLYENNYLFAVKTNASINQQEELYMLENGKEHQKNLSEVLEPTDANDKWGINHILKSIPFNNEELQMKGRYVKYNATSNVYRENQIILGYIGEENRKAKKEKDIQRLKTEIEGIEEILFQMEEELSEINVKIDEYESKKKEFVKELERLQKRKQEIEQIEKTLEKNKEKKERISSNIIRKEQEIQPIRNAIREMKETIGLIKKTEDAISDIQITKEAMNAIEIVYHEKKSMAKLLDAQNQIVNQLEKQKEIKEEELSKSKNRYEINQKNIASLEETLAIKDAKGIEEKISKVLRELSELPERQTMHLTTIGTARERINTLEKESAEIEAALEKSEEIKRVAYMIAEKEFEKKEHSYKIGQDYFNLQVAKGFANQDIRIITKENERKVADTMMLKEELEKIFRDDLKYISEFTPNIYSESVLGEDRLVPSELDKYKRSSEMSMRYNNIDYSALGLEEKLNQDKELMESIITEEEKKMIDEFLLGDMSKEIKKRIDDLKLFMDNMNKNMQAIDTSLKLKITWQPARRKSSSETSTKDILRIMTETAVFNEDSTKKIRKFYTEKIDRVKKIYNTKDNEKSLRELIEEELDYTEWFEFALKYRRSNEESFEDLTNEKYGSFSGGERGMSVYIPLFSCVNILLENVTKETPRIISLDEAFARIDAQNTNEMFGLISMYNFDFVMNSEKLWGTFENIKDLNIIEIIREPHDPLAVVYKYHWNGKKKVEVN